MTTAIFKTVPEKDHFLFYPGGHLDYGSVVKTLEFKKEDVSKAAGVPLASVRYEEEKIPQTLQDRIREWAVLLNLVAQHFKGNVKKTCLWFTTWTLTKSDQVMRTGTDQGLAAGILVGKNAEVQAAWRMAGFSARAGKASLGARRLTASFGKTMVRHF